VSAVALRSSGRPFRAHADRRRLRASTVTSGAFGEQGRALLCEPATDVPAGSGGPCLAARRPAAGGRDRRGGVPAMEGRLVAVVPPFARRACGPDRGPGRFIPAPCGAPGRVRATA